MDKTCGDRFEPFEGVLEDSSRVWIGLLSPCRVLKDSSSLLIQAVVTVCSVSAECEALAILNTYWSHLVSDGKTRFRNLQ